MVGPGTGAAPAPIASGSALPPRAPATTARPQGTWTSCRAEVGDPLAPADGGARPLTRLTETFAVQSVVLCQTDSRRNADGSEDQVGIERLTTDPAAVARLVAALRLPDRPPYDGACSLVGYGSLWLFLLDAGGRWTRPALPSADCGGPRAEVTAALTALPARTVATWTIRQTESAAAVRAGCTEQWSDMVHVVSASGAAPTSAPTLEPTVDPFAPHGTLRGCVYRVPASELSSPKPGGTFERGGVLSPDQRRRLGALLTSGRPAAACRSEVTHFAVIAPTRGYESTVYVELDGCRRTLTQTTVGSREHSHLTRAPAALLDLLAGP